MCDKDVNTYHSAIQFLRDCYNTQEMCDKAVKRCFLAFIYIPDRHKTQERCDEAVDDFPAALKLIPDWFATKKLLTALFLDDKILYFNEDSVDFIFSCNEMGILSVHIINNNLDHTNYDEDHPKTIIHVRLLAWYSKLEKCKALKKDLNEELMIVTWHHFKIVGFVLAQ